MINFTRPPMYRSARAVAPSTSPHSRSQRHIGAADRGVGGGYSIIHVIRILLGITALAMIFTTVSMILPMFHSVDSRLMDHIDSGSGLQSALRPGDNVQDVDDMHHGVHKNIKAHIQGLKVHLQKEFAKGNKQEQPSKEEVGEDVFEDADEIYNADYEDPVEAKQKQPPGDEDPAIFNQEKADTTISKPNEQHHVEVVFSDSTGKKKDATTPKPKDKVGPPPNVESQPDTNPKSQEVVDLHRFPTNENQKLARGFSGLPMEMTPALVGAKRGTVECDVNVKYVNFCLVFHFCNSIVVHCLY